MTADERRASRPKTAEERQARRAMNYEKLLTMRKEARDELFSTCTDPAALERALAWGQRFIERKQRDQEDQEL